MDEFVYLVVRDGELQRHARSGPLPYREMQELLGGGLEGVPIPDAVEGLELIGYVNSNGIAEGLGANCYVFDLRYPVPGPLVISGMSEAGGSRSLTEDEVRQISLREMNGRPLPTLWIEGFVEPDSETDPAAADTYEPGRPMDPPPVYVIGYD